MKTFHYIGFCLFLTISQALCPAQKQYYAVFLDGNKVGYSFNNRQVSDGKVATTEMLDMTVTRLSMPLNVKMSRTSIETTEGKPLGFKLQQDLGLMAMDTTGTVKENGDVDVTVLSMGGKQTSSFKWPQDAVMAEGLRLISLKQGLKPGTKYSVKVFSPELSQAVDAHITVGEKTKVKLIDDSAQLTQTSTAIDMPNAGRIESVSYVDDDLQVKKTITPVAGMTVEMIACTEEFAKSKNDPAELASKLFLDSPRPLDGISSARAARYRLAITEGTVDFKPPETDSQSVLPGSQKIVVTVRPVDVKSGGRFPYQGNDPKILEALKPTAFVQSDNEKIIQMAQQTVGNTRNAAEAARKIEAFVANYIDSKNLTVGYASAVEVLQTKQGDCTEFSVLTAALCRALGIPARVVSGIAYVQDFGGVQNKFGGHAWVEAYVGGKWLPLDASFKSSGLGGFDPGHIALAVGNGDPADFLSLATIIGRFEIEDVRIKKRR